MGKGKGYKKIDPLISDDITQLYLGGAPIGTQYPLFGIWQHFTEAQGVVLWLTFMKEVGTYIPFLQNTRIQSHGMFVNPSQLAYDGKNYNPQMSSTNKTKFFSTK